jgi:hypothetical protein
VPARLAAPPNAGGDFSPIQSFKAPGSAGQALINLVFFAMVNFFFTMRHVSGTFETKVGEKGLGAVPAASRAGSVLSITLDDRIILPATFGQVASAPSFSSWSNQREIFYVGMAFWQRRMALSRNSAS